MSYANASSVDTQPRLHSLKLSPPTSRSFSRRSLPTNLISRLIATYSVFPSQSRSCQSKLQATRNINPQCPPGHRGCLVKQSSKVLPLPNFPLGL
ncbi:Uncharacterized protein HZ326_8994 [Fusarium oxysporum f. sp. albedinis]|nr:Uncharacterized protein HZ326_8994 [Fusarium oxysporum f. sp. albedinis]